MNSTSRFSALFSILFIIPNCNLSAQKTNTLNTQIDSLLKFSSLPFNGAVLINQKGKTIYSNASGFADFDTKKPLTINSQFEIMSNSKQVAAVLILREVEKGKIDLQSPIKKYIPELTQTWADDVTVHQLLNHTHGIESLDKPLAFKPGTDFRYGNMSYTLLTKIVEFSSKKSYSEMADNLFKDLKMKNTFCYSKDKNQNLVSGYINDKNVFEKVKKTQITAESLGADGVVSTVKDLAIWDYNLHKGKTLKPETYKLMVQYNILSQHNVFGKEKAGYGYGVRIVDQQEPKYIGHTGIGDGFSSLNLYFTESDTTLIILENQMNTDSNLNYATEIKIKNLLLRSDLLK